MERNKLIEYLKQTSRDDRTKEIVKQLTLSSENSSHLRDELEIVWNEYDMKLKGQMPDFQSIFDDISMKIDAHPALRSRRRFPYWLVAAVMLFVCVFGGMTYFFLGLHNDDRIICEVTSKKGVRTMIQLSDGTKVWLNDCTTLRYPQSFRGKKERSVYIDGEAYFDVVSDARHPFIVETEIANTIVTGTKFNLSSYSEDRYFEVSLIEGTVELVAESSEIELIPGNTVKYDVDDETWIYLDKEAETAAAWLDGAIVFDNESLEDVARRLSHWFGMKVEIADPEIKDLKLTARIKTENIDKVFAAISSALQIRYEHFRDEQEDEKIIIYNKITIQ